MKNKKTKKSEIISFTIILMVCFSSLMKAQQGTNTAGGEGKGMGGTVSISIGQMDYTNFEGPGGNVSLGVQQAYVIEVTSGYEISNINLSASVYPNPSSDFIMLTFERADLQNFAYTLYDMAGKRIDKKNISESSTQIKISDFNNGNYFLNISENNNVVKTFKIIKTK